MLDHLIGDRYRVQRKLGEGGMAVIYLAVDEKLGRNVAVKVLREKFENHSEIRTRFQHEARAISSFDHPNILKVYDYSGQNSQRLWIVTELIHGRNLGQIVETAPGGWLHPVIAACIVREICKALNLAHASGIVHRDVKPDNVMMTQQGAVKLMDFGIAKIQQNNSMTQTGMFMGSPSYMSPEQVRGRDVDHRSDIYSLGVLFYELVTGKLPFSGQSTADIAIKILGGQYQHPRFLKEHLPPELNDLIVGMMASDPPQRPRSADTVAGVIDQYLQRNGFETSTAELERCFRDPKGYGERLARLVQQTVIVALPTQLINQRTQAATKLPDKADPVSRMIRSYNEHAIDNPKPFVPETLLIPQPKTKRTVAKTSNVPPWPSRRDHALPRKAVALVTRKVSAPTQIIVDHLPERRYPPRQEEVARSTQHAPRGEYEQQRQASVGRHLPPQRIMQGRTPRSLPRVPQRMAHHVRYVVHRDAVATRAPFFSWLLTISIFVAVGFVGYQVAQEWNLLESHPDPGKSSHTRITQKPKATDSAAQENSKVKKVTPKLTPRETLSSDSGSRQVTSRVLKEVPKTQQKTAKNTQLNSKKPQKLAPTKASNTKSDTSSASAGSLPSYSGKKVVKADPAKDVSKLSLPPPIDEPEKSTAQLKPEAEKKEPHKPFEEKPVANQPDESLIGLAKIQVSAAPAAEIYVNGRRLGTSNDAGTSSEWMDISSGVTKIELRREGYAPRFETVTLKAGERRRIGPVTLSKDVQKSVVSKYRLTVTASAFPANVSIVNLDTKAVSNFVLKDATHTTTLERGVYDVTIERNGETRKRRVDLTGTTSQLTFSAEFREGQN